MREDSSGLHVRDLTTTIGAFTLGEISMDVQPGTILAIVGPSGCGKSTLLRSLGGLIPSKGSVWLNGADVSALPPERRPTAMVFQSPALFPQMTVRENVGFGLDDVRMPNSIREDRIEIAMLNLNVGGLADVLPDQLSGGQAQRVALARTLVRRPGVLLLDEPLSNVEPNLRRDIRRDIANQVRRGDLAALYVTHDLDEAFGVADRVVIMKSGTIIQEGDGATLYRRPANRFVADFLGQQNILPGTVLNVGENDAAVLLGRREYRIPAPPSIRRGPALIVIPPQAIELTPAAPDSEIFGAVGQVTQWSFLGQRANMEIETELGTLVVDEWDPSTSRDLGSRVHFTIRQGRGWVLPD